MDDSNEKLQEQNSGKKVRRFMRLAAFFSGGGCLFALGIFVVFLVVLLVFGIINVNKDDSLSQNCVNVKSADEICKSITVVGHGTMSVDKYVAGVINHEYGGADDEVLKAQAVAARSYGLAGATKDGNGNCSIGNTTTSFQTFDDDPSQRCLDAANATSGMILVDENGNVYSTEYSSCSFPKPYSSFGDIITISERDYEIPRSSFDKYRPGTACSDDVVDRINYDGGKDWKDRDVYGSGHGRGMGQLAASYLAVEKNYTYDQILEFFYGKDSKYKLSLASTKGAGSQCSSNYNGEMFELDDYDNSSTTFLTRLLTDDERQKIQNLIDQSIEYVGHGTGNAVAASAQGLIYGLKKYTGTRLGYLYGGGHGGESATFVGVSKNWGTGDILDCSGFVAWATRTGCNPNFGSMSSGGWSSLPNVRVISLSEAKPGDVLANGGHIELVVKNLGDGRVIIANESSTEIGLVFQTISDPGDLAVLDMSQYYANNCTNIQKGKGSSLSSKSKGVGKILLVAGHSYSPYCNQVSGECREAESTYGYAEPTETRKLALKIKKSLISLGVKEDDVDIVNELFGENLTDNSTDNSKSLFVECALQTSACNSIDYSKYKFAMEIHFNGGRGAGVTSICNYGDCGSSKAINSEIRSAVYGILGGTNYGEIAPYTSSSTLQNITLFNNANVPFVYLETEYYDNRTAMDKYANNSDKVAYAIAKVIKDNYF